MSKADSQGEKGFVWVSDKAGNQFICPVGALKDPKDASQSELANCIDDAKAGVPIGD
ncbi:MAG: hypothetical protein KMY53_07640 [Desulfarculus sp.]|nr:hypothetical protein [Pseudomonadota bacterium]MBV1718246.1 hypothetical protein [Desulfarculus sp.]MBU4576609.1 hypothetical protein [Pseudomonadota bacterium]MBU4597805.1 hypothetical protein [Pseudomonadota bacterium]MBV1738018.1 hypothetical protein [Desulfarculus sp.]